MKLLVISSIILIIKSSIEMFNSLACNIKKKYDEKNFLNVSRVKPLILYEFVLSKEDVCIYTERHYPLHTKTKNISNNFSKKFDLKEIYDFALIIFQFICSDSDNTLPIYFNIKNKTPGHFKNFLIYDMFKNFKTSFRVEIDLFLEKKSVNIETESSFIHNLLTKNNKNCYSDWFIEDNKVFIIFCIGVGENYHIFKVDIKELDCERDFNENVLIEFGKSNRLFEKNIITNMQKLYSVTDILVGAKKKLLPQIKYSKTSISVNENANYNMICEFRKFSIKIKKDKIIFKNLDIEFCYSFNLSSKPNEFLINRKAFTDIKKILCIYNDLNRSISYPKMFYNVLRDRNLVPKFFSSILKKPGTGSFLILIHLMGNLGIYTAEELINISESCDLTKSSSENFCFSSEVIDILVKTINDLSEFDIASLFKLLLFLEVDVLEYPDDDTDSQMITILDQLKNLQNSVNTEMDIDMIKIHKYIFKESQCFIDAAIKTLNMIFENVDQLIKSYKNKNSGKRGKEVKLRKVRSKELISMDPLDFIIN